MQCVLACTLTLMSRKLEKYITTKATEEAVKDSRLRQQLWPIFVALEEFSEAREANLNDVNIFILA